HVPVGVLGELDLGGPGVANGYLNRPDLTAERFIPDPFSMVKGARINIVFVGRNDHQVKIRDFRIELSEIELHLVEHPQVSDVIVIASDNDSNKHLIAYVVAEPDPRLVEKLKAHVVATLPEYMVPAAFVRLDNFPLTPNGKVDRRALPEPDENAFVREVYEAPRGETERAIAAIWSDLLGIAKISRQDSLFTLGGHSLLVVKMLNRLHQLGQTVSARTLFKSPTLAILARALGKHHVTFIPPNLITPEATAIMPEMLPLIDLTQYDIDCIVDQVQGGVSNIQDIYSLAPLQDGILFHHLLSTEGDPYLLVSHLAFESRSLLDRYLDAFQKAVNRHDVLRTSFFWKTMSKPAQ
ncbi:hypothetical protein CPB97_005663, partial [Podila verticillata]